MPFLPFIRRTCTHTTAVPPAIFIFWTRQSILCSSLKSEGVDPPFRALLRRTGRWVQAQESFISTVNAFRFQPTVSFRSFQRHASLCVHSSNSNDLENTEQAASTSLAMPLCRQRGHFPTSNMICLPSRDTPPTHAANWTLCVRSPLARSLSWSVHRTASVLIDFPPLLARLLLPLSVFRFLLSLLGVSFFPSSFLPLAQDEVSRFGASTSVVAHAAPAQGPRSATPQP